MPISFLLYPQVKCTTQIKADQKPPVSGASGLFFYFLYLYVSVCLQRQRIWPLALALHLSVKQFSGLLCKPLAVDSEILPAVLKVGSHRIQGYRS